MANLSTWNGGICVIFKKNNKDDAKGVASFRKHLPKIMSVFAAIVLWFYVIDVQNTTEEKVIPGVSVLLENFDNSNGLAVVSDNEHTIEVTVSGTKSDIAKISQKDIIAIVDMSSVVSTGNHKLDIDITSPQGVSVVNKSASEVSVYVDKTTTKNIPVEIDLMYDKLNPEYEVGTPILSHSSVQVTGPQRVVDSVDKLKAKLKAVEINETFKSQVSLEPVNAEGGTVSTTYITLSQSIISVTIPVYKSSTVGVTPVFAYSNDYEFKYRVVPETIKIRGEVSDVDSVSSISTAPITSTEPTQLVSPLDLPGNIKAYNLDGVMINAVEIVIEDVIEMTDISNIITKEVPVSYDLSYLGKLNVEAYEISEVVDKIETMTITGPERVISTVDRLRAQYNFGVINDTSVDSYSASCCLVPIDANGNVVSTTHITFEKPVVDVGLNISKKIRVGIRPVFSDNTKKYDYTIVPNIISIKGAVSTVSEIELVLTKSIDVTKKGKYDVQLDLPDTVKIFDLNGNEIESVTLEIHKVT